MKLGIGGLGGAVCVAVLGLVGCSGELDDSGTTDERDDGDEAEGDGSSGGDEPGEIPAGCEDVLAARDELPDCGSAGCRIIEETPERVVEWRLSIESNDGAVDEAFWHRVDCVRRQLESLGLYVEERSGGDTVVAASYQEIASVVHTAAIESLEASCPYDDCPCAEHDEAACTTDPLCAPIVGKRLDTGDACYSSAGCGRYDRICGQAFTSALDSVGACWLFNDTCLPEGFTSLPGGTEGCGYAEFDALPRARTSLTWSRKPVPPLDGLSREMFRARRRPPPSREGGCGWSRRR